MMIGKHDGKKRKVFPTIDFSKGKIEIIDQTLLPSRYEIVQLSDLDAVVEAIVRLRVRGAPAIGIAAAYGILLSAEKLLEKVSHSEDRYFFDRSEEPCGIDLPEVDYDELIVELENAWSAISVSRPTAVNLFWALNRMKNVYEEKDDPADILTALAKEAFAIHEEELQLEYEIGDNGAELIEDGMNILTHCNAGGLATAGYGTALAVLYSAVESGKKIHVFADETRPLLQGARLTAWELSKRSIGHTVICDDFAATLFASGRVDAVIVGADRIASNGDTANKIGTLGLAILCEKYDKPFYVAAPSSTFDFSLTDGSEIPIEERAPEEVAEIAGKRLIPDGSSVYNPAFDVTPAGLIEAIITEKGIVRHPDREKVLKSFD